MYWSSDRVARGIQQDHQEDPAASITDLAQRHRVSRRVVREALGLGPERSVRRLDRPLMLAPVADLIDELIRRERADGAALSIRQIRDRLAAEAGFTAASPSTVRDYVRKRRFAIAAEAEAEAEAARAVACGDWPEGPGEWPEEPGEWAGEPGVRAEDPEDHGDWPGEPGEWAGEPGDWPGESDSGL